MNPTAFSVKFTTYGCRTTLDGLVLEAAETGRDRRVIRAVVSAIQPSAAGVAEALVHRDQLTLTRASARNRFTKAVETKLEREIPDLEKALEALEQGLRERPRDRPRKAHRTAEASAESPPESLDQLNRRISRRLLLGDPDAVPVVVGTVAAHALEGDSPWLQIVGPPSGTKSELVMMLDRIPGTYFLSELTEATFASGLREEGKEDPSLLAQLTNEILLFKDFTTVLGMPRDVRQAILGQLREFYDGRYDKSWGTGKRLEWTGRLGFISGVTPIIDTHHAVMAVLGQRFLLFRLRQANRVAVAEKAITNARKDDRAARAAMADDVAAFMKGLPRTVPDVPERFVTTIAHLADLVTSARSGVERDGYRRELEYAPEREMPARLGRQLYSLARGLALVDRRAAVSEGDLARVARVALDCIPAVRRLILEVLMVADGDLATSALGRQLQYSTSTVRRALEDLQALDMVTCEKGGQGTADKWRLNEEWRDPVQKFFLLAARPREPLEEMDL